MIRNTRFAATEHLSADLACRRGRIAPPARVVSIVGTHSIVFQRLHPARGEAQPARSG